jgi:hypothetical protein
LQEAEGGRGLLTLTVNMQEPAETVGRFARRVGLHLPILAYTSEMDRELDVRKLPTIVLVDRWRRIRGRWDGYGSDVADVVGRRTAELLEERQPPTRQVAEVLRSAGEVRVAWTRELPGGVDGMAVVDDPGPARAVLVAAGRHLIAFGPDGRIVSRRESARGVGQLRAADLDGDRRSEYVGFRRWGQAVAVGDVWNGEAERAWTVSGPVLDVLPVAAAGGARGELLLVTPEGVRRASPEGDAIGAGLGAAGVVALAAAGGPGGAAWVGLDEHAGDHARLVWLDRTFEPLESLDASEWATALIGGPMGSGFAELSEGVMAASVLRGALAVVTGSGQLVILDGESGEELLRARWPATVVAAGDLDGDGDDELAVADRDRLSILEAPSRGGAAGAARARGR